MSEYWIDSSGFVAFCDGDIGDMNHESYVISCIVSQILNHFNIQTNDASSFEDHKDEICKALDLSNDSSINDILFTLKNHKDMLTCFDSEAEKDFAFKVLYGHADARVFALQFWSWVRVIQNNLEFWNINAEIAKTTLGGLYEIIDQEDEDDYEKINVEIRSRGIWKTELNLNKIIEILENYDEEKFLALV